MTKFRGKQMPETEGLTQIVEDIRRRVIAIEQEHVKNETNTRKPSRTSS